MECYALAVRANPKKLKTYEKLWDHLGKRKKLDLMSTMYSFWVAKYTKASNGNEGENV